MMKKLTLFLFSVFAAAALYAADVTQQRTVLTSSITTASPTYSSSYAFPKSTALRSYSATVAGTGAVTATVVMYGSNDEVNWVSLGTITLSGTTSATDGFASNAPWPFVRAGVTAISGTSATVTVVAGI